VNSPARSAASYGATPVPSSDASTPLAAEAQEHVELAQRVSSTPRFEKPDQTRVFVVANQKGGVGKTTTTVNIAAAFAMRGLRVLVIDLDPQGNTSTALNIAHQEGTREFTKRSSTAPISTSSSSHVQTSRD